MMLEVHSSAFEDGALLPLRFASARVGGSDLSPPLSWTSLPPGTKSVAVTCVDHAPIAREFVHWMVVDLPPDLPFLAEGASRGPMIPNGARELPGDAAAPGYVGASPPEGSGPHPYEFTVWALDLDRTPLAEGDGLDAFLSATAGHVLVHGSITAVFER
jgi:Raf kinase inhibitor-like YbhB/YbcL family protein